VKPAQFEYFSAHTKKDALDVLSQCAGNAMLLAGGQSLLPMMNFRLVAPQVLIDLNGLSELAYIGHRDGAVTIGSMTRQRTIEFSSVIAEKLPLLSEAVKLIGHAPIRTRGTIGGSLAQADPAAEVPMILLALEGEVVAESKAGTRIIQGSELYPSLFTTSLRSDEIITEIRIAQPSPGTGYAVKEFARREGDFAIAAVAATISCVEKQCVKARLSCAGVGSGPTRLFAAEAVLEEFGLDDASVHKAAKAAEESVQPQSDMQASADFRRHLVRELTVRAVQTAVSRAA
jgi:CO/xanthine dehydrogenase FAD-binding subunit